MNNFFSAGQKWAGCLIIMVLMGLMTGCTSDERPEPLFVSLSPGETGITFENTILEREGYSFAEFPFLFNGGGVAIGDINNNGLPDVFLSGNMVSSKLYLNKGNFQFEDITKTAGVETDQWISGVSFIDINNNGYLDMYLSVMGVADTPSEDRRNMLYINNGDETFTEAAADYNLDYSGFTTHSAFFDYNGNGYLDVYLMNNSPASFHRSRSVRGTPEAMPDDELGYDKLFRNNGDGTFTDVSDEAGILRKTGYGLGIAVADFNRNGWPDVYISNDITPNDVLYINNGDGTFTDRARDLLRQTSFAGMGIDAADYTNNGWPDLMQTDMMPERIEDQKLLSGGRNYELFQRQRQMGFFHYYSKNALQLNNGVDADGDPVFSDISRMAGVAYTDWSWAVLFGDYNNNGLKDLMVTNGYPKAVIHYDYLNSIVVSSRFGTREEQMERALRLYGDLYGIEEHNYLFKNTGDLIFNNVSQDWGFTEKGYSYGAAYADLNNNGALDFVINNIDAPASVYRNRATELTDNRYLKVDLEGEYPNRQGLGTELIVNVEGEKQYYYHTIHRGYQSTVDDRVHLGLGEADVVDSLEIFWPDGRYQLLQGIEANQVLNIRQTDAIDHQKSEPFQSNRQQKFTVSEDRLGLDYHHNEKRFIDFRIQPSIAYKLSRTGPSLAVGDVSGNGLDDLYIGGASGHAGVLYLQQEDGTFAMTDRRQPWDFDQEYEDTDAVFFDANGNGRLDLYVGSGGYHATRAPEMLRDRLYLNMGDGRFLKDEEALPRLLTNTSVVLPGDFTGDGRTDLFIGGGMVPGNYPDPAGSYLLGNEQGRFVDVTGQVAPELSEAGMISDALWFDYNNNGRPDLVTAGIWQPVRIYENNGTRFREVTSRAGLSGTRGWWYSLAKGDFNGDGTMDLIAGNLGLNHTFTTSEEQKFGVYANDFDDDMTTDIIYKVDIDGVEYSFFGPFKLGRFIEHFSGQLSDLNALAETPLDQMFSREKLEEALHFEADTFASMHLQNNGDGTFVPKQLPQRAQISPVRGIIVEDVDGDGIPDLLIAGNDFKTDPDIPRLDAGKGLWLRGDGHNFEPLPYQESGFLAPLDVRNIALLQSPTGPVIVVANNEGPLQMFRTRNISDNR